MLAVLQVNQYTGLKNYRNPKKYIERNKLLFQFETIRKEGAWRFTEGRAQIFFEKMWELNDFFDTHTSSCIIAIYNTVLYWSEHVNIEVAIKCGHQLEISIGREKAVGVV